MQKSLLPSMVYSERSKYLLRLFIIFLLYIIPSVISAQQLRITPILSFQAHIIGFDLGGIVQWKKPQISLPQIVPEKYIRQTQAQQKEWLLNKTEHSFIILLPWYGALEAYTLYILTLASCLIIFFLLRNAAKKHEKIQNTLQTQESIVQGLYESIPMIMGIVEVLENDIRYISHNPAASKYFGYNEEDIKGKTASEIGTSPEYLNRWISYYKESQSKNKPIHFEYRHFTKDGAIWLSATVFPIKNLEKGQNWYCYVAEDITKRKSIEKEIKRAHNTVIESSKLKSEFLANMSHEIRTPMNGVIGMTDLLLDTELTEEQQDFANTIKSSAEDLLVIINDILDFSKIEAGKLKIEIIDFDIKKIINNCIDLLSEQAKRKDNQIIFYLEDDVPTALRGDPVRFKQIITNLLSNAIKFTDKGKIELKIYKTLETQTHATINIQVIDTGIGIPEGAQKKLFQSFTQADGSTTRKYGGTGLGLAICKQLVELMSGEIGINSTLGQGSTFWIILPLEKQAAKIQELVTEKQLPSNLKKNSVLYDSRILVVEDNVVNQKVIQLHIRKLGYPCDVVSNGLEALEALSHSKYALVFMDCQMPGIDGFVTTEEIRKRENSNYHIPIIALTALITEGTEAKCFNAGMNDYLTKPVQQEQILKILKKWIPTDIPSQPNEKSPSSVTIQTEKYDGYSPFA